MRASGWRSVLSGSLQGFFDLQLPSGLVLNGCMLHERDGNRWVGLPGKAQIEDGRQRLDPKTGRPAYTPVVEIPDRAVRDKFTEQALAALDRLLNREGRTP
jgi:hypothetical protein